MGKYIKSHLHRLTVMLFSVFVASCSSWMNPESVLEVEPSVFPDYKGVTIPCNIAPMNFMVEGADSQAYQTAHSSQPAITEGP